MEVLNSSQNVLTVVIAYRDGHELHEQAKALLGGRDRDDAKVEAEEEPGPDVRDVVLPS